MPIDTKLKMRSVYRVWRMGNIVVFITVSQPEIQLFNMASIGNQYAAHLLKIDAAENGASRIINALKFFLRTLSSDGQIRISIRF